MAYVTLPSIESFNGTFPKLSLELEFTKFCPDFETLNKNKYLINVGMKLKLTSTDLFDKKWE